MDRRVFINSVACVGVAVGLAATAQVPPSPNRPRRVVWLQGGAPDTPDEQKEVDDALAEVGWFVGKNVLIDRRYVGFEDLPRTAMDFVNAKVDLIVASGTPATLAAKSATTSIPILMWSAADPVGSGLVASLARPGGNVTGMALLSPEQRVKRLSLIREQHPDAFTSSHAERAALPLAWWESRLAVAPLASEIVLGTFQNGQLAGAAGLSFEPREKARHKATVFGMYVPAAFRRRGLGRQLVLAVLEHAKARSGVTIVQLTVTHGNIGAHSLYEKCGFVQFGLEPFAIATGSEFLSKIHMWCDLGLHNVAA